MKNNPTWTIDPEYDLSPWEDSVKVNEYRTISNEQSDNGLFQPNQIFKSSFTSNGPFSNKEINVIGFRNKDTPARQ